MAERQGVAVIVSLEDIEGKSRRLDKQESGQKATLQGGGTS
ncbi:hypothetical protein [Nitrosospira lacus]|nr:hypothetical protein [Nitrosospira lacus]